MPYVIERNGKCYSGENRHKSVWVGDKADALEYGTAAEADEAASHLTGCARTRDVASMKLVTSAPPNVTELIEAAHRVVDCFSDTEPLVLAAPGIEAEKAILQLRRILETKE